MLLNINTLFILGCTYFFVHGRASRSQKEQGYIRFSSQRDEIIHCPLDESRQSSRQVKMDQFTSMIITVIYQKMIMSK